jgi:hypothetical protein
MEWLLEPFMPLSALLRNPYASLFCALCLSFTLLSSALSMRAWKRLMPGDFASVMLYFGSFFALLFALPLVIILIYGKGSGVAPSSFGMAIGNWRLGLIFVAAGVPFMVLGLIAGVRDPAMREYYPFSRQAMSSPERFVLYESAYLVLYYLAWEFTFRGVMLFGLLVMLPPTLPGILIAVVVQTVVSTVFHLGHPDSEILAAFVFGVFAGLVTAATGSFLYALVLHASAGILNDSLLYRRFVRARRLERQAA